MQGRFLVTYETVYPKTEQKYFDTELQTREFIQQLKHQYYTVAVRTNEDCDIYSLDSTFWN